MIRQESGHLEVGHNAQPDMGSSQHDFRAEGSAPGHGGIVDAAKEKIQQFASQARETASEQAESRFSSGKTRATQTLGSIAQTLKSSSQQLRDQEQAGIGQYADRAAAKIEEISQYLETASLRDVAQRVENFARREPALFIGGAVAVGFLGARFLKSSQRNQEGQSNQQQGLQQRAQSSGAEQGIREPGGPWQGAGDREVTSAPRREWTTGGMEPPTGENLVSADRMGRS